MPVIQSLLTETNSKIIIQLYNEVTQKYKLYEQKEDLILQTNERTNTK